MASKNIKFYWPNTIKLMMEPVACPRPRVTKRGIAYYPEAYRNFKKSSVDVLTSQWKDPPLTKPLSVSIIFLHTKPKSKVRKKTANVRIPRVRARGDLDNFIKSILDSLQSGGVIKNDSQVWKIEAESWYAALDEQASITITLTELQSGVWSGV